MMLHTSKQQYNSSLNDLDLHLTFTQGHKATEELELVESFSIKLHEVTQMFVMADYGREMTSKKSYKCGEY